MEYNLYCPHPNNTLGAKPRTEGREAFKRGIEQSRNPYSSAHPFHGEWNAGWESAYRQYVREQNRYKEEEVES